jgi:hypothetical protein
LSYADKVWAEVKRITKTGGNLPRIEAGPEDFVEFRWAVNNGRSLELWVYGEPHFYAEWCSEESGESSDFVQIVSLIKSFLSTDAS